MMQQRPVLGLKVDPEFADLLDKMLALSAFTMDGHGERYNTRSDFIREAIRIHFRKTVGQLKKLEHLKPLVDQEMEKSADWEKWMD